jgi:hypothetical protein
MGILPVPLNWAGETPTPQLDNLFFGNPLILLRQAMLQHYGGEINFSTLSPYGDERWESDIHISRNSLPSPYGVYLATELDC